MRKFLPNFPPSWIILARWSKHDVAMEVCSIWKSHQKINSMLLNTGYLPVPLQPSSLPWQPAHSRAARWPSICKQALTMLLNSDGEMQWRNSDYSGCGKIKQHGAQNTLNAWLRSGDALSNSPYPHTPTPPRAISFFTPLFYFILPPFFYLFKGRTMSEDKKSLKFPSHNRSRVELTFLVVVSHFR